MVATDGVFSGAPGNRLALREIDPGVTVLPVC